MKFAKTVEGVVDRIESSRALISFHTSPRLSTVGQGFGVVRSSFADLHVGVSSKRRGRSGG